MTFLGLTQMFGACILFLLMSLIVDKVNIKDFTHKTIRNVIGCLGVAFVFWSFYGVFTDLWIKYFANLSEISIKKILVVLFKYPDIFTKFIYPWIHAIPFLSFCLLLSCLYVIFILIFQRKKGNHALQIITIVSIVCLSLLGVINTKYTSTRYSFFLYPVFVILFLYAIKYLVSLFGRVKCQSLLFFFSVLFLFVNSDDFSLNHLLNISTPEINFRKNYDKYKEGHFYRRYDFKSPSEYVNNNAFLIHSTI